MKPVVGLHVTDHNACAEIYHTLRDAFGVNVLIFEHPSRWATLAHFDWLRERVVCVIDDDPEKIMDATALGFHGVVWSTPDNIEFSWHLRGDDIADLREGVAYRLKEWRDKHKARA